MSFQQGLSGLNISAKNLAAIGNNVANASTIGFKAARAEFADVFANSLAGGGVQVGIGASVAAVRQQFTQGNISTTSNPLDVAINGAGFFRLSSNGVVSYARNGQFALDRDGYIVTSNNARLTGYPADANGQVIASTPIDLRISLANISPRPTSDARIAANLDSRDVEPVAAFGINDPSSYNSSTAMTVYDSQGNAHTLTLYFRKTAGNTWDVYGAANGTLLPAGGGLLGTLNFGPNGLLAGNIVMNASIPLANGAVTPLAFPVTFPQSDMTQFGVNFAVSQLTQDGFTTGRIAGFSISDEGIIFGRYTNGQTRAQGQIVLANFINPQGLAALGNNAWSETAESGQPLVAAPGSGSLGTLQSGALEEANVDLTEELVKMITAQRVYQANAQTIRTQDQVLQTLVNLR